MSKCKEEKEPFCVACLAGVGALVGLGTSGINRKSTKKSRKIIFWAGVGITVISILIMIYFLFIRKCNECSGSTG